MKLALHGAIGAGLIYGAQIGGSRHSSGRWEYIVTGDPLDQVAAAEKHSMKGKIVVSKEAWGYLSLSASGKELRSE